MSSRLPVDAHGYDVDRVWALVRQAVKTLHGFEVVPDIVLSDFSFAKFLMWRDLTERIEALKANRVVRHLIETPRDPFPAIGDFPDPRSLDRELPPERTFTPLPVDSSQLAAVVASTRGLDMIIEGPPGTGKSQTIANIIAQTLAEGRTVLFVSEKTAALEVVYRRLTRIGLSDFCLQLHSNRANKKEVLEQLRAAWDARGEADEGAWAAEADRLKSLRDRLNSVAEHLHRPYRNGLTPYLGMARVIAGRDQPAPRLTWPSLDTHDRTGYEALRALAGRIDRDAAEIGPFAGNPLTAIHEDEWRFAWEKALVDAARNLGETARRLDQALLPLTQALGLDPVSNRTRLDALAVLSAVLAEIGPEDDLAFAATEDAERVIDQARKAATIIDYAVKARAGLSAAYADEAIDRLDLDGLSARWTEAGQTWWPRSMSLRASVRKTLAPHCTGSPNPETDLNGLKRIKKAASTLDRLHGLKRLGPLWRGRSTDGARVQQALDAASRLRTAVLGLAGAEAPESDLFATLARGLERQTNPSGPDRTLVEIGREFRGHWDAFLAGIHAFDALAKGPVRGLADDTDRGWLDRLAEACDGLVARSPRLRLWCAWRKARGEAVTQGLEPLVAMIEAQEIAPGRARAAFDLGYARWWSAAIMDEVEVLRTFVQAEHEMVIDDFRRLDDQFAETTRDIIRARLAAGLPSRSTVTKGGEFGVLSRELAKQKRHKPLRQLVSEMPTGLTKLTPCLLMSPLSIAQYLDPGTAPFDLVVFDEASQIPTWDAVGAIARGRQAIVVGDPKQMPPTTFFGRNTEVEDDEIDLDGGIESILDECLGANLPLCRLTWHYRSRHESLIAFSNHTYYGGRLVTFPSPVTEDRALTLRRVDGTYQKGGARTNPAEARALVDEILLRLRQGTERSIGVVTFNAEQQRLIEDLLDRERAADPDLEWFFADDREEPVMVKNLESVQGDERDVILFSVTYGPDAQGKISMNLGPMNQEGGPRRLNVAVTRARHEMVVFSTIGPEDIDLSRTMAAGVHDLKLFLTLAERGPRAFAEFVDGRSVGDFESPFEEAVAESLANKGWRIVPQIGVSTFRVDLGVVHPDHPGRFLAGVECDGATYHRSATARDRDKLREQVLRSLGWEIVRIWSTDWWSDAAGATTRLDARLQTLLEEDRAKPSVVEAEPERLVPESMQPPCAPETPAETPNPPASVPSAADDQAIPAWEQLPAGATFRTPPSAASLEAAPEQASRGDWVLPEAQPDQFYEPGYEPTLMRLIAIYVEAAGPIATRRLATLVARHHGFERTGARIQKTVTVLADRRFQTSEDQNDRFYWPASPEPQIPFRDRLPFVGQRDPDDICGEELSGLISELGAKSDRETLVQLMANRVGIRRVTARLRSRFHWAIDNHLA